MYQSAEVLYTLSIGPNLRRIEIAEGKLNAFFGERVLMDQDFINAEAFKGKIGEMLKKNNATLVKYERIEVGQ